MNDEQERPGGVFISYSWDDQKHRNWVRSLANRLEHKGVDVVLDARHVRPGQNVAKFIQDRVAGSSHFVCICTPRYKKRADALQGGVGFEIKQMQIEWMKREIPEVFIPILRRGTKEESVPRFLAGLEPVDLSAHIYDRGEFERLVRTLLNQPLDASPTQEPTEPRGRLAGFGSLLGALFEDPSQLFVNGPLQPRGLRLGLSITIVALGMALCLIAPWSRFSEVIDHAYRYVALPAFLCALGLLALSALRKKPMQYEPGGRAYLAVLLLMLVYWPASSLISDTVAGVRQLVDDPTNATEFSLTLLSLALVVGGRFQVRSLHMYPGRWAASFFAFLAALFVMLADTDLQLAQGAITDRWLYWRVLNFAILIPALGLAFFVLQGFPVAWACGVGTTSIIAVTAYLLITGRPL